ncbi:MAG: DUF2911 domain-containing protein [Acidobacteriota bacterium]
MKRTAFSVLAGLALVLSAPRSPAPAQIFKGVTLPPSGGNERQTVVQQIGLVRVSIDYSSPHVHSPSGEDRRGKIWGGLVPYGMTNLGFGTCGDQCPWRGGANENTVFTTSHDIKMQGQPLPAGSYGLHFIPGKDEWTVVFSKNSTSWGSFYYDAKEDALRVKAKPQASPYREVLTYDFTERRDDTATVALEWEELALPLVITVDDVPGLYVENMRRELRSTAGFDWRGWEAAAQYCVQNKTHLEDGLAWAQAAVSGQNGQENFQTLSTLSQLQGATGKEAEAQKTMDRALNHPTAGPNELHQFGRQLLAQKKPEEALKIFQLNARRHPNQWPVHFGLMRGYSALGKYKESLAEARLALAQAPDPSYKKILETMIEKLQQGKDIN